MVKAKASFREEVVEPEKLEDKGTSHNQGTETATGCMEGKPPPEDEEAMSSKKQSSGLILTLVRQVIK